MRESRTIPVLKKTPANQLFHDLVHFSLFFVLFFVLEIVLFPTFESAVTKLESSWSVLFIREIRLGQLLLQTHPGSLAAIRDKIKISGRVEQSANVAVRTDSPLKKMLR